ncbi:unnamed protein product [Closterium sp. NIES-54]
MLHNQPAFLPPPLPPPPPPRGTAAGDLVRRLKGIYARILGSSTSLRIITSPIVTPDDLRNSQLCTVQVVPVYPTPVDPPPGLPEGEEGLREGKEGAARGDLDELFGASGGGSGPLRSFQFSMPPSALAAAAAAAVEGLVEGGGEGRAGEEVMRLLELGFGGAAGAGYGMGSEGVGDISSDIVSGTASGRGAVFPVWRHRMVLTVHARFPSLQLHLPVVATHSKEASPLELVLDESVQWTRRLTQLVATWRAKTGRSLEGDGGKDRGGGGERRRESGVRGYDLDEDDVLWGMGGRGRWGRRSRSIGGKGERSGLWRVLLQVAAASLDAMHEVRALQLLRSLKERPAGGGGGGGSEGTNEAGEACTDTGTGLGTERVRGAEGSGEVGGAGEERRGGSRWAEGLASRHVARAMGEVVAAAEAAREGVEGVGKPMAPLLAWLEDAADATPPETLAALARYGLLDGGGGGEGVWEARGVEVRCGDEGSSAAAAAADGAADGDATPSCAHPTPRELARAREQCEAEREIAAVAALAAAAAAGGEEAVRVGNALTDYVEALSAVVQAHEREMGWGDEEAHEEVKARAKGVMEELYLYVPGIRPWDLV